MQGVVDTRQYHQHGYAPGAGYASSAGYGNPSVVDTRAYHHGQNMHTLPAGSFTNLHTGGIPQPLGVHSDPHGTVGGGRIRSPTLHKIKSKLQGVNSTFTNGHCCFICCMFVLFLILTAFFGVTLYWRFKMDPPIHTWAWPVVAVVEGIVLVILLSFITYRYCVRCGCC
mmetsp:Transcript_9693/g.18476  ORF Transcript_9693/g.18476 Transcript_9693/m.18476 type:complete len:169 (+) Transcript_9693:37-543(+)